MRALLDANILLDVVFDRAPHSAMSTLVWGAAEMRQYEGFVAAHALTTIYYLEQKRANTASAKRAVRAILTTLTAATVSHSDLMEASTQDGADFEDAVTAVAAEHANCDALITRDPKGFRRANIRILSPEEFWAMLQRTN